MQSMNGEPSKPLVQEQPASQNTLVSRKRCPSPNSLARLDPRPPRALLVNKGDVEAFREVLEMHRVELLNKMMKAGVIK